jgi:hypothetical protein
MVALIGVGAFAVHQIRFMLWYGQGSDGALGAQGHAYLGVAGPVVLVAAVLASASFLDRLARGARTSAPRFGRLWAAVSALLVAVYCLQESLESLLASGHPGGIGGVLGHGGWLCVPLSVAVGLVLALVLRGAAHASDLLRRTRSLRPAPPAALPSLGGSAPFRWPREPWVGGASARAPPTVSPEAP